MEAHLGTVVHYLPLTQPDITQHLSILRECVHQGNGQCGGGQVHIEFTCGGRGGGGEGVSTGQWLLEVHVHV